MRFSMLVMVLTFLVTFHPSLAQQHPESMDTLGQRSDVRFSIQGILEVPEGSLFPLPLSIIEQLEQQPALMSMRLSGTDALPHESSGNLEVRFVFAGMQAFREWYEAEQTQTLLEALKERSSQSMLDFALHVSRPPFSRESNE